MLLKQLGIAVDPAEIAGLIATGKRLATEELPAIVRDLTARVDAIEHSLARIEAALLAARPVSVFYTDGKTVTESPVETEHNTTRARVYAIEHPLAH
jgi:hypothetical protein